MTGRSRAREVVLQLLYRDDLNEPGDEQQDNRFLGGRLQGKRGLTEFATALLQGVRQQRDHLDRMLDNSADHWNLNRMAATDRNILRLAVWEIRYGDTPERVVINEAIELAKRYGDKDSPRFVNGVLDRLIRTAHVRETLDHLLEGQGDP